VKTPRSKDDFAKHMMDTIRQTGEKGKIVYDSEEFSLRGEGKTYAAMFLTNAYREYCAAPFADRSRIVRHYVRNWFSASKEMPEDFEDVKPDLLPVVRSRAHFEIISMESDGSRSLTHEPLAEHLGIGIVYDLPESMRSISQASFDAWGVTFYEALEVAMENLLSLPSKFIGPGDGEGAYLSTTGDNYDASRLLIKDAIRGFQVKGDPIAMVPNREKLIVVGSEDGLGLAWMAKLATKALKDPRPISGIALRLDGDEWTPWMPPPSHPSYKDFKQLQLQTFGQDYAQQKDMLDKLHEKNGEDVFVANFSAIKAPDGTLISYATWTETTNSLLPKTDVLVLGRLGTEPRMVEWPRVVEEAGDLMAAVDIYPPRFRVREFPSETQLAAMGNLLP
jgi:uncharacterized protein YtpQ (UPF0354 family)